MPLKDDDQGNDSLEGSEGVSKEVLTRLEKIEQQGKTSKFLTELAQDPDVQRVVELKRAGKKVNVSDVETQSKANQQANAQDVDLTDEQIENLDNKGLVKVVLREAAKTFSQEAEKILSPIKQEFEQIRQANTQRRAQEIDVEIEAARKKYSDFDALQASMIELHNVHKTLGVEQLYHLAKAQTGAVGSQVTTERPTNTSSRPTSSVRHKQESVPQGSGGFQSLLSKAMEGKKFETYEGS